MSTTTRTPPNARIAELEARAATMAEEMDALLAKPNPTPQQADRLANLTTAAERLGGQIEEARTQDEARMGRIREHAANPAHVQSGDGARYDHGDFHVMRRGSDPWEGEVRRASAPELRDRALYACEWNERITDDMTGVVDELLNDKQDTTSLGARWAIATSRSEYRTGFEKFLKHPHDVALYLTDAERHAFQEVEEVRSAWAESSTTTGGFAVPADYDLSLLLQNAGSTNPFRKISRIVRTTSNIWKGLGTGGVTASWNTESNESSDRTPSVSQPSITVWKGDAYLQASYEVLQDSPLGSEVAMLLADARDQLEASAHATGSGGGQPFGAVTRAASLGALVFGDSGSTVEKELVVSDLYALDNALGDRYYDNASWVANRAILNTVRRFGEGTTGSNSAFWTDLGAGIPPLLLGHPAYASSAMDGAIASGSTDYVMLLGDFRQAYIIVDRVGTAIVPVPVVFGSNRRPTGEAGFYGFFRSGADVSDATSALGLKLLRK